jgi:hypothetical protein
MSIDDQRIFVCEKLLGWKYEDSSITAFGVEQPLKAWHFNGVKQSLGIPPLTLDWLWECAKALPKDKMTEYHTHLYNDCGGMSNAIEATAEQRLAALVQTIGGKV